MAEIEINFTAETLAQTENRLAKGYRARRNFLVAELLSMIVYSTPVKDGHARGGWYVAVGASSSTAPAPPDKDGGATVMRGLSALKGASPFSTIFIKNDVDYITKLEEGSSLQAPQGMVKVSLSAFKSRYGREVS